jgi:SAM-dependent methyltransferase
MPISVDAPITHSSHRRHLDRRGNFERAFMGRFASTVDYYETARPPYGPAFFSAVARRLAFERGTRLLDVGTGPGLLAIGFAPFCGEVVGVDPEPAMIEAAREAVARAGVVVHLIEGRFEDVGGSLGAFDVVTIGRAIHWLDPGPALETLGRAVAPKGTVLVCRAASAADGRNRWLAAFDAARKGWGGERPAHDHESVLSSGGFVLRETISVEAVYAVPVERLADRVLSMSGTSPDRLGDDVPAMRSAIHAALAPFAANGVVEETVESWAEVFERATDEG